MRNALGRVTVVAGVLILMVALVSLRTVVVAGVSMADTLRDGDRLIVLRLDVLPLRAVRAWILKRDDIVVARDPSRARAAVVKRIVATSGDDVVIVNGQAAVNGERVPLPPTGRLAPVGELNAERHLRVPERAYFLLSDNRATASDSRVFGPVARDAVIGLVLGAAPGGGEAAVQADQ